MYQDDKYRIDKKVAKALRYFPNEWWAHEQWRDCLKRYWKGVESSWEDYGNAFVEDDRYDGLDEDQECLMRAIDSYVEYEDTEEAEYETEKEKYLFDDSASGRCDLSEVVFYGIRLLDLREKAKEKQKCAMEPIALYVEDEQIAKYEKNFGEIYNKLSIAEKIRCDMRIEETIGHIKEQKKRNHYVTPFFEKERKMFEIEIKEAQGKATAEDIELAKSLHEEIQEAIDLFPPAWGEEIKSNLTGAKQWAFDDSARKDRLLEACIMDYAYTRDIDKWMETFEWNFAGEVDGNGDNMILDSCEMEEIDQRASKIVDKMTKDDCSCVEIISQIRELSKAFDQMPEEQRVRFLAKRLYSEAEIKRDVKEKQESNSPLPMEVNGEIDELPF